MGRGTRGADIIMENGVICPSSNHASILKGSGLIHQHDSLCTQKTVQDRYRNVLLPGTTGVRMKIPSTPFKSNSKLILEVKQQRIYSLRFANLSYSIQ